MDVVCRSEVKREQHWEDASWIYFFVWWVMVVDVEGRNEWHHSHLVRTEKDECPEALVNLVSRVENAVASGLGEAHFNGSRFWAWDRHETLQEKFEPFGTEWRLEQRERDEARAAQYGG